MSTAYEHSLAASLLFITHETHVNSEAYTLSQRTRHFRSNALYIYCIVVFRSIVPKWVILQLTFMRNMGLIGLCCMIACHCDIRCCTHLLTWNVCKILSHSTCETNHQIVCDLSWDLYNFLLLLLSRSMMCCIRPISHSVGNPQLHTLMQEGISVESEGQTHVLKGTCFVRQHACTSTLTRSAGIKGEWPGQKQWLV